MGCDYYIYKYLVIEHKEGIAYYPLKPEKGYYPGLDISWYNSDSEDYDNKYREEEKEYSAFYNQMVKLCLTPRKPLILYENGRFLSPAAQDKYTKVLRNKINKKYINNMCIVEDTGGEFTSIDDVITVTKKEIRYEPGNDSPEYWLYNEEA
jgi:hypothetical protein